MDSETLENLKLEWCEGISVKIEVDDSLHDSLSEGDTKSASTSNLASTTESSTKYNAFDKVQNGGHKGMLVIKDISSLQEDNRNSLYAANIDTALSYKPETAKYACSCCSFTTPSAVEAMQHLNQQHNYRDLYCFCCNYSTNEKDAMYKHIATHVKDFGALQMTQMDGCNVISSIETFRCFFCTYTTISKHDLEKHCFLMHVKKRLVCVGCEKKFHFIQFLQMHVIEHHSLSFSYNCLCCTFTTNNRDDFGSHIKSHETYFNDDLLLENYRISTNKDTSNILELECLYKCYHCPFYTIYKYNLILHLQLHKKTDVSQQVSLQTSENLYECKYCSFFSLLKKKLKEHVIKTHPDEQPYFVCKLCGKYFATARGGQRHMKKIHTETKKLYCMHCPFSTIYFRNLERHMEYHTGEFSQLCYVCGLRSVHECQMDVHIREHFGVKKYSCNVCDYKTSSRSRLCSHLTKHSNERPFACDECDHRAKSKQYLKLHKQIHAVNKQFSCTLCDYKCMRNYILTVHMKIHAVNQDKIVYKCDKCPKQYARKRSLKEHERIHNGVKLFCRFCEFSTSRSASLQLHEGRHSESSRMYCFQCNYSSTHRGNFTEHVNKTCIKANHRRESLRYCYYCKYKSGHRSNFIKHVNEGCAVLKRIMKKRKR